MFRQREETTLDLLNSRNVIESHTIKNGQNEDGLRNANLLHNPPHSINF